MEITSEQQSTPMDNRAAVLLKRTLAARGNLRGIDLSGEKLGGAKLRDADLQRADISRADLHQACLAEACLYKADLTETDLGRSNLIYANLKKADLSGADLAEAALTCANLTGAALVGATLIEAHLLQTDLTGANLAKANLSAASLEDCCAPDANLSQAILRRADLRRANLRRATLREADLQFADLRKTDLRDADLRGADLRDTDLRDADLRGADLKGADLRGASLVLTRVGGSFMAGARFGGTVFAGIDLSAVEGLAEAHHLAPSYLHSSTLRWSRGRIPETFLNACGLLDWEVPLNRGYHPRLASKRVSAIFDELSEARIPESRARRSVCLFADKSSNQREFVELLRARFLREDVTCWVRYTPPYIDSESQDRVVIIVLLSKNSTSSERYAPERLKAKERAQNGEGDRLLFFVDPDCERVGAGLMDGIARMEAAENGISFYGWQDPHLLEAQFCALVSRLKLFAPNPAGVARKG